MIAAHADTDTFREVEERAFAAWPALRTVETAGWLFREAGGYTKRANSANALRPEGPFEPVREAAEAFYAGNGLPAIFRLSPLAGSEPEARLEALGYRRIDETIVKTAPLPDGAADGAVTLRARPDAAWCEGFADANAVPAERRAIHDRMLEAISAPMACASLDIDGRPAALGLAVADRGWLGLFDVVTRSEYRRHGLARRVIGSLFQWGQAQGATRGYIQVVAANDPARALYRGFGFRESYRYHYRVAGA